MNQPRPAPLLLFLAAAAGALAGGFVVLAWAPRSEAAPRGAAVPANTGPSAVATDEASPRFAALEALETVRTAAAPVAAGGGEAEAPAAPAVDDAFARRVRELEARLGKLETQDALRGLQPADSPDALRRQIAMLRGPDQESMLMNRAQRMALCERFLARFPDDPKAKEVLGQFVEDALFAGQPVRALEMLQSYVPRLPLATWERELMFVGVYNSQRDEAKARGVHERVLADPGAPTHVRANAAFFVAYSHLQEGHLEQARAGFEQVIATYGGDPAMKNTVDGARAQLAKIDEQLRANGQRR